MPGLVPGIHVLAPSSKKDADGAGTSPAMTEEMDLWRAPSGNLLDLDPIGIEGQMAGDFRHRRKWRLVGPDRVFERLAVGVDAEIIRIPLVGAVRHSVGARQ